MATANSAKLQHQDTPSWPAALLGWLVLKPRRWQRNLVLRNLDADQLRDCGIDPFHAGRVGEVAARRNPNIDIRS